MLGINIYIRRLNKLDFPPSPAFRRGLYAGFIAGNFLEIMQEHPADAKLFKTNVCALRWIDIGCLKMQNVGDVPRRAFPHSFLAVMFNQFGLILESVHTYTVIMAAFDYLGIDKKYG